MQIINVSSMAINKTCESFYYNVSSLCWYSKANPSARICAESIDCFNYTFSGGLNKVICKVGTIQNGYKWLCEGVNKSLMLCVDCFNSKVVVKYNPQQDFLGAVIILFLIIYEVVNYVKKRYKSVK